MIFINCYYIFDAASLSELVSVSDTGALNIKYLQTSVILPQYKFWVHSQYFEYIVLSVNLFDWNERLTEESGHSKYVQPSSSTQIEMVVSNNAWVAPSP